jgi:hypothetical protein
MCFGGENAMANGGLNSFFIAFMQYIYLLFWCLDLTNHRI